MADSSENDELDDEPRRWPWVKGLVLLFAGIALLPSLVTVTGKHSAVLGFSNPELAKALKYESISTHWWQAVEIQDAELHDLGNDSEDAIPVLTAKTIRTKQPLWKLALSGGDGVDLVVEQPVLNLIVDNGLTNLESAVNQIQGADESASNSNDATRLRVKIENGLVRVVSRSTVSNKPVVSNFNAVNGTISTLAGGVLPAIELTAALDSQELSTALQQEKPSTRIAANLDRVTADFPMQPFAQSLSVDELNQQPPSMLLNISEPEGEQKTQQLRLETRRLNLADIQPLIERWLPTGQCQGLVSCRVEARLLGDAIATGLAGRIQMLGEEIAYRDNGWSLREAVQLRTVMAEGSLALADDGIVLQGLQVRSPLLNIDGEGTVQYRAADPGTTLRQINERRSLDEQRQVAEATAAAAGQVKLSGNLDLAALSQMIPQTLKLADNVALKSADVQFSARVNRQVEQTVSLQNPGGPRSGFGWKLALLTSPLVATRDGRPLEVKSQLRLDADGAFDMHRFQLQHAQLKGDFGNMTAQPIPDGYSVTGQVDPQRAWNDLRTIFDMPRPGLQGPVDFSGHVLSRKDAFRFQDVSLTSPGLEITAGQLDVFTGRPALQMLRGSVDVRGNAAAFKTVIAPWHDATWLANNAFVAARLTAEPNEQIELQGVVRPPQQGRQSADGISSARVAARLVADALGKAWVVEQGEVELPGVKSNITGTLASREGLLHVNLQADTGYDLLPVTRDVLQWDEWLLLDGKGRDVFTITGSPSLLTPQDEQRHRHTAVPSEESPAEILAASGSIEWTQGRLYGAPVGPGEMRARLQDGLLSSEPVRCTLAGGDMAVMPRWDLSANVIQLTAGSRIDRLQLTPEFTKTWLSRVAPLMSDSAQVEGSASVRFQQFAYDLSRPERSTFNGAVAIHDASASPGQSLGPLLQALQLLDRNAGSRRMVFPEQTIAVRMQDGWIQHDGLQIDLNGYLIRSSGAVSAQNQVDLALQVPLEKSSANGSGRHISVPVGGSLSRPQINTAGLFQNLGRQQINKRLNNEVDRGLNRLFNKL